MNREFVSYNTALALKELGFDEPCLSGYQLQTATLFSDIPHTLNGEKLTVSQWARKVGINKMTILRRLNLGWSDYDAVFKDIKKDVELSKVELVPKLRELGLKVEDIAFFCKVKPNAIYNILKKHKYDNNNRKTKVSNKR